MMSAQPFWREIEEILLSVYIDVSLLFEAIIKFLVEI